MVSTRRRTALAVLAFVTTVGCGGQTDDSGNDSGDDAASGGGPGSGGGSVGAGGQPGDGGSASGDGGTSGSTGGGTGGTIGSPPWSFTPTLQQFLDEFAVDAPFENDFPEAPTDYVPPVPTGEPGWRDSTGTLCSRLPDQRRGELWADADGVALLTAACRRDSDEPCGTGSELWYNDGSGWDWLFGLEIDTYGLAGVGGGDLLVQSQATGAIAMGRDGELHGGSPDDADLAWRLFGDGLGPAYALLIEPVSNAHLYEYDGTAWTDLTTFPDWVADSFEVVDGVAYTTYAGIVGRVPLGGEFELMDIPAGPHADITGLSADNLWVADAGDGDILHYDGDAWTQIGKHQSTLLALLAVEDEVYFISDSQFGRLTETDVSIIQTLQGATFEGLAGVSKDEIFISLIDGELAGTKCGGLQVFVYDGEEFHRF
jgi:hypothetical protein